ncbi:hypothetical protein D3C81_2101930 [compost metagenome]
MPEAMKSEFLIAFREKFGFGLLAASANDDAAALLGAAAWAWQASREAVVVQLTEEYELPPTLDMQTLVSAIREQDIATIEAQGLKVKP